MNVSQDEAIKGMMRGEFASVTAMHSATRDLAPAPISWGTYFSNPNVYFLLYSSHDMTDDIPDLGAFPSKVARLHKEHLSPK